MNEYSFCEMEPEVIVEEEVIEKEIGLDIERSVKKSPERYLIGKVENCPLLNFVPPKTSKIVPS